MQPLRSIRAALLALALAPSITALPVAAADNATLSIAAPWEIGSTDPATDGFIFLRMGVMETLVDVNPKGDLAPGLATQWSADETGLTWRFEIRKATFHDGSEVTAQAAASALKRAAGKPGPLGKAPVKSIEADGNAVVITLDKPFAALPAMLAHYANVIAAPTSFDASGKAVAAIGSGPFMVKEIKPPQSMSTQKFDKYWGKVASLPGARYMASSRSETRALLAESGDADLVFTLDPAGFKRLGQVDEVMTSAVPIPRVMLIKVNSAHPMLNDKRIRHALSLGIDRAGIAAGIARFPDAGATQMFPPAVANWHDPALPALGFNPEQAKEALMALGWTMGSNGILEKDGKPFSLTMRTFPDRPELPLVAAALQDQWRQIGIELKVSVSNYSEIPAGHQDNSLELALFARNYGGTADPIGSVLGDFGNGGGDWGAMNWDAPETTAALEQVAANGDAAVRAPLIAQVAKTLHDELPLIPVLWYQHTVAHTKKVGNVQIDPLERSYRLNYMSWEK